MATTSTMVMLANIMTISEETAAAEAAAVVAAATEDASAGEITRSARSLAREDLTRLTHAARSLTLAPTLAERAPSTPPAHVAKSLTLAHAAARNLAPAHVAGSLAPSPARRPRSARSLSPATRRSPSLARRSVPRRSRRWSRRSTLSLPADLAPERPADRRHAEVVMATVSEDECQTPTLLFIPDTHALLPHAPQGPR